MVSQRNAIFMENEVNGIHVDDAIIRSLKGWTAPQARSWDWKSQCRGCQGGCAPMQTAFYLMTPFNRVALMERLIARLRTEVTD